MLHRELVRQKESHNPSPKYANTIDRHLFAGAIYHVMSRGDRREDIFLDDVDRQDFLKTLAEACQKTGWQTHAYCLMGNHFHLVIETPDANLVAGMRWLLSTKRCQWFCQKGVKKEKVSVNGFVIFGSGRFR